MRHRRLRDFDDETLKAVGRFALAFGQLEALTKPEGRLEALAKGKMDGKRLSKESKRVVDSIDLFTELLEKRLLERCASEEAPRYKLQVEAWATRTHTLRRVRNDLFHNWAMPAIRHPNVPSEEVTGFDLGNGASYLPADILKIAKEAHDLFDEGQELVRVATE